MYIVIELFPDPFIVVDGEGNIIYFNWEQAIEYCERLQKGKILEI